MAGVGATKIEGIKLDARDIKILSILQREGRIPKAALAERVNLSATPCWERSTSPGRVRSMNGRMWRQPADAWP